MEARLPAVAVAATAFAVAPEALALVAASRVSPPDDARRPVFDDVAEMERWTFLCPEAAVVEPVPEPVDACDE